MHIGFSSHRKIFICMITAQNSLCCPYNMCEIVCRWFNFSDLSVAVNANGQNKSYHPQAHIYFSCNIRPSNPQNSIDKKKRSREYDEIKRFAHMHKNHKGRLIHIDPWMEAIHSSITYKRCFGVCVWMLEAWKR